MEAGGFAASALEKEDCMAKKATKIEEALEVKALRRIISAYLNYSDAAEDDVKRWERSYAKLIPQHKALVVHLPKKYQRLRRCIATNSYFILNMLQAFEPPFDMIRDEDDEIHKNYHCSHHMVPQSAERQQSLSEFYEMQDAVGQQFNSVEPFHTTIDTHGMPNTFLQELSSGNRRSNETVVTEANVLSERNLCQVPSFSADGDSTPYTRYNVKLNSDFSDGNRNTSVPTHNHDLTGIDRDKASYTTCESVMLDHIVSAGCCRSEPNVSRSAMSEAFNQQSTCHSAPATNREENCIAFDWRDPAFQLHVSPADADKVRCILRNIVRDWAPEGAIERKQCYQPILDELQRHFPNRSRDKYDICIKDIKPRRLI